MSEPIANLAKRLSCKAEFLDFAGRSYFFFEPRAHSSSNNARKWVWYAPTLYGGQPAQGQSSHVPIERQQHGIVPHAGGLDRGRHPGRRAPVDGDIAVDQLRLPGLDLPVVTKLVRVRPLVAPAGRHSAAREH